MNEPRVAIIIVNWNGLHDTIECLNSLQQITYSNYEVIVVDNGSTNNEADIIEHMFSNYIKIIRNTKNNGCGEGYNTGIRYVLANSKPDYILVMNNDLNVAASFLSELVNVAEQDNSIGIAGPKIYYYDYKGRKDVLWSVGGKTRPWLPRIHKMLGLAANDTVKYNQIMNRDWVSGAILLLKTSLIETIGIFDPCYFFGLEDIDYCLKARKNGFMVLFVPNSKVWHKVSASAKKLSFTYLSASGYYYLIKKNFPTYLYIYHLSWLPVVQSAWAIANIVRYRNKKAFNNYLLDLLDFLKGSKTQKTWRQS